MRFIAYSAAFSFLLVGCGSSETGAKDTTATIQGALVTSSFPGRPTAVQAIDDAGTLRKVNVDSTGTFLLDLPANHLYRLEVTGDFTKPAPVVFPRASGRLDLTFHVAGGGSSASLGAVRYLEAAPSGGFIATAKATAALSTDPADPSGKAGADGECVDGKLQGTETACVDVDEDGALACDQGEDDQADGECVDGKDQATGNACTDTDAEGTAPSTQDGPDDGEKADDAEEADPNLPMAVPEHNVPDEVAGCEQGEEEDD